MSQNTIARPEYGNWVSKWLIYIPGVITFIFLALSVMSPFFVILAAFFVIVFAYFAYSYYRFSLAGGDMQTRIRSLVLDHLKWDGEGRVIDIGCGNAALSVKLAQKYGKARITGIDYWGGKWGYSRTACERNAEIEGVADRTSFLKASALSLPFADGYFDAAVSNFVFHEVRDAADKREVIKEALRVVKTGGVFAFQDLFLYKRVYGDVHDLLALIRSWGITDVEFVNTSKTGFIPRLLKLPFMVGSIGIIYGKK